MHADTWQISDWLERERAPSNMAWPYWCAATLRLAGVEGYYSFGLDPGHRPLDLWEAPRQVADLPRIMGVIAVSFSWALTA